MRGYQSNKTNYLKLVRKMETVTHYHMKGGGLENCEKNDIVVSNHRMMRGTRGTIDAIIDNGDGSKKYSILRNGVHEIVRSDNKEWVPEAEWIAMGNDGDPAPSIRPLSDYFVNPSPTKKANDHLTKEVEETLKNLNIYVHYDIKDLTEKRKKEKYEQKEYEIERNILENDIERIKSFAQVSPEVLKNLQSHIETIGWDDNSRKYARNIVRLPAREKYDGLRKSIIVKLSKNRQESVIFLKRIDNLVRLSDEEFKSLIGVVKVIETDVSQILMSMVMSADNDAINEKFQDVYLERLEYLLSIGGKIKVNRGAGAGAGAGIIDVLKKPTNLYREMCRTIVPHMSPDDKTIVIRQITDINNHLTSDDIEYRLSILALALENNNNNSYMKNVIQHLFDEMETLDENHQDQSVRMITLILMKTKYIDDEYRNIFLNITQEQKSMFPPHIYKLLDLDLAVNQDGVRWEIFDKWANRVKVSRSHDQEKYVKLYGFAIPTKEAIEKLRVHTEGRKILSVFSGKALFEKLLSMYGQDVTSTDDFGSYGSEEARFKTFMDVENIDAIDAINTKECDTLMMVWPPMGETPYNALMAFKQKNRHKNIRVVYVGQLDYQAPMQANGEFSSELLENWTLLETIDIPARNGYLDTIHVLELEPQIKKNQPPVTGGMTGKKN